MIIQRTNSFQLCSPAAVLDNEGPLRAWAERYVRSDPDIRWVIGNYVEADEANSNGHIFPLADLFGARHSLDGKPLNMMHREHYIVGTFVATELLATDGTTLTAAAIDGVEPPANPYLEALAALWHRRFPEEFFNIRKAHADGSLFFSMEAIPDEVSCPSCSHRVPFAGVEDDSYCEHMQGAIGPKILHNPVFNGGAIVIPPARPGWSRADVTTIAQTINAEVSAAETAHALIRQAAPHLSASTWEEMMAALLTAHDELRDRDFSPDQRKKMAKSGTAMPDGSYPIETVADLRNAISAIGRAKNPAAVRKHIRRRAKALGRTDLIPENW